VPTTTILSQVFQLARDGLPIAAVFLLIGGISSYTIKRKAKKGMTGKSEIQI